MQTTASIELCERNPRAVSSRPVEEVQSSACSERSVVGFSDCSSRAHSFARDVSPHRAVYLRGGAVAGAWAA